MRANFIREAMLALVLCPALARGLEFEKAREIVSAPQRACSNLNVHDLQVAIRLCKLHEAGYAIKSSDLPQWKAVLERPGENYYAKLCAANFLINSDANARAFIEAEVKSPDLRHRYNAAKVLSWSCGDTSSAETRDWALQLMIERLADGSMDGVPMQKAVGDFPDGDEGDIHEPPADAFCFWLAHWKITEAVPAIITYLQRQKEKNAVIIDSLGDMGDPRAVPFLMQILKDKNVGAYALGKLKATEAVPLLISKLSQNSDPSIHYFQGPDDVILRALRDIGAKSAVPVIQDYFKGEHRAPENLATARRVLIELNSPDPVHDLIAQFDREDTELARGDILFDLADNYRDPRAIALLSKISETSSSAFLRTRAMRGLGRIGTTPALLELIRLLTLPFPEKLTTDWGYKAVPKNFTTDFHDLAAECLRDSTHQDFGQDTAKWQAWVAKSSLE